MNERVSSSRDLAGGGGHSLGIRAAISAKCERLTAAETPEAAIHAGYYAMFHCARAVLINRDGEAAPTKHGAVASRFGYDAHQSGDPQQPELAAMLRHGLHERIRSDYHQTSHPEAAEAEVVVQSARRFIEGCARLEGFAPPPALAPPS